MRESSFNTRRRRDYPPTGHGICCHDGGVGERPFRLLSLASVASLREEGNAEGEAIVEDASQRDALARLLWEGRTAAPLATADGRTNGRVTLASLLKIGIGGGMSRFLALIIKLAALLLVLAFIGSPQVSNRSFSLSPTPRHRQSIHRIACSIWQSSMCCWYRPPPFGCRDCRRAGIAGHTAVRRGIPAFFTQCGGDWSNLSAVAVLALCVPILGFGNGPTLIALVLYGLLPIFENALTALENVPPAITEAARGAGMTDFQRLWQVKCRWHCPLSSLAFGFQRLSASPRQRLARLLRRRLWAR